MERRALILVLVCFAFYAFYPALEAGAQEKQTLARFSLQFPPKHHLVRAADLFAKTVAEKAKGSIKIQVFPAAQLYKEDEITDAVASKSVEMGDVLLERWGGINLLYDVLGSNKYLANGYELSWRMADGPFGQYIGDLMRKNNCHPVFWSCSGVYKGVTNSKRPMIKSSDWKGLMIRVSNAPMGEMTKLFGGSPVLMSGSEAYDAMQRRTVDGSETTLSSVYDRKYYEIQKYLTVYMDYPSYHIWVVNNKWWTELPKDKQDILAASAKLAEAWDRKELDAIEADYIAKLKKLMTVHIQTDEEAEEWRKAAQPVADKWLKETGPEGRKLLNIVLETVREYKASKKK